MTKTDIKLTDTIKEKLCIRYQSGGYVDEATSYEQLCKNQEQWFKDNCHFVTETWKFLDNDNFEEIYGGNTYNEGYEGATINTHVYEHKNGTKISEFAFHRGGDVRGNYGGESYYFIGDFRDGITVDGYADIYEILYSWLVTYQITFSDGTYLTIDDQNGLSDGTYLNYVHLENSDDLDGQAKEFYEANKDIELDDLITELDMFWL